MNLVGSVLFYQVQNFITHFWQGMPGHIISVLECPVVVDIVAICDSILYKVKSRACSVHDIEERSERSGICMTVYSYSHAVSVEDK